VLGFVCPVVVRHRDPVTLALLDEEEAAEQHALEVLLDEYAREVRVHTLRRGSRVVCYQAVQSRGAKSRACRLGVRAPTNSCEGLRLHTCIDRCCVGPGLASLTLGAESPLP